MGSELGEEARCVSRLSFWMGLVIWFLARVVMEWREAGVETCCEAGSGCSVGPG